MQWMLISGLLHSWMNMYPGQPMCSRGKLSNKLHTYVGATPTQRDIVGRGQSYPVRSGTKHVDLLWVQWNRNHRLLQLQLPSLHQNSHQKPNRKPTDHSQLGVWMSNLVML